MEDTIFSPLAQFGTEVVELAVKIPLIAEILVDLRNSNIPIKTQPGLGAFYHVPTYGYNRYIAIGIAHKFPIDILAALVHEYTHFKTCPEKGYDFRLSQADFTEFMVNEELMAYQAEGDFLYELLDKDVPLSSVTEYSNFMESYLMNHRKVEVFVKTYVFPSGMNHYQYYAAEHERINEWMRKYSYAVAN